MKVTFWPACELTGVAEIEVVLACAVVTEPAAPTANRTAISFLTASADYVPADPNRNQHSDLESALAPG